MTGYIVRRLVGVGVNLVLVSIFIFFSMKLVPGDLTMIILTERSTEEQRAAFRKEHGLDKPQLEQYLSWAGNVIQGDFGKSYRTGISVADEFKSRAPITLEVAFLSFTFTSILGVTGGLIAATRQDTYSDYLVRSTAILGTSIPSFLMLTLLLIIPALLFNYAPPFGAVRFADDPISNLQLVVPPAFILAIGGSATLMRLTRTAMLDVMRQDYLRTARSKGLTETSVVFRHALRNALPPILTYMGLQIGFLLSGSIILEQILGLPGLGTWNLLAITAKDYPIVMIFSLFAAAILMTVNLLMDLLYAYLDPRIRYS
jgi:peptide/nickel transport system permease protein